MNKKFKNSNKKYKKIQNINRNANKFKKLKNPKEF